MSNSFDPDQEWPNIKPDLGPGFQQTTNFEVGTSRKSKKCLKMSWEMHKIVFFSRNKQIKKLCVPTQTRYPKHTYFLFGLINPVVMFAKK